MKTIVLMVSTKFPASHKRAGEPTNFPQKIESGEKIHTIRGNLDLWLKRFEQIARGEARLSIRVWTDKPYRSPQQEIASLTNLDGIGVEELNLHRADHIEPKDLAKNDGLCLEDYISWFKDYNLSKLAIIHFTKFRYRKEN